MLMQFLIIWHFCGGSDAIRMEETQKQALLLVPDGHHLSYPTSRQTQYC